ncbi:MucR family transcriptional regulator [Methylobacterium sp. J-090]|uniref:MucR family transcriptional regulator n=1 Tax=Methylobacterium sp. J-090 TaxID=2836666 RepID=UPI001FB891DF|nr:MucR family transcriptional regulator [Methylobacterium sp. J-090]MCJ2081871.1 MucR family transcriptional regulator [Methylobacterium sp. J-090]
MRESAGLQTVNILNLAGVITAAFVSNSSLSVAELPALIRSVHTALSSLATNTMEAAEESGEKPTAAQIRKSVTPDGIVSFVDGKTYKTMKRHLTTNGFDPYSYRERFGLPADYPMVASNYAAQRSALAKSIGLGRPFGGREVERPVKSSGRKQAA